jgi:hypothetical protein
MLKGGGGLAIDSNVLELILVSLVCGCSLGGAGVESDRGVRSQDPHRNSAFTHSYQVRRQVREFQPSAKEERKKERRREHSPPKPTL